MADKKEVTIKGANEQRFQIKNATDQEGAELKMGETNSNPPPARKMFLPICAFARARRLHQ